MTEWKNIMSEELIDWELQVNNEDEFRILDRMTGDNITITQDDKEEIYLALFRLLQELEEEK